MLKRLILVLYFMSLPVFAGVYENAMSGTKNVLLYMYTDECKMCKVYTPFFNQLAKKHTDIKFVKINAHSFEGAKLMRKFGGGYVPFVVLSSPKTKNTSVVNPYCSVDEICMERVLKNFKG